MNLEPISKPNTDPFQSDMVFTFFANNDIKGCLLKDILSYLMDSYNFVYLRSKYSGKELERRISRSISSLLNACYEEEYLIAQRNFDRKMTEEGYVYFSLPKTSNLVLTPLLPTQLALDYDTKDEAQTEEIVVDEIQTFEHEETTMQENSPLIEDILASDKINDPIQRLLDNYSNIDLYGIDEVKLTATKAGKKITIIIANA